MLEEVSHHRCNASRCDIVDFIRIVTHADGVLSVEQFNDAIVDELLEESRTFVCTFVGSEPLESNDVYFDVSPFDFV